jgi:protein ImuA
MDLSALPTAGELSLRAPTARWRPGLAGALHSEIFAAGNQGSGVAAALALALDTADAATDARNVLWVQDRAALRLTGRPYRPGLPAALRRRMIHVAAAAPEDALFALEEGLRCRELACVIGEIAGNPKALDFTASRRLSLAAERHGVPLFLVRLDAARDLSAARMRWQVTAAPSPPSRWNAAAPGTPCWRAELFRARTHPPGEWILRAPFDAACGVAQDGLRDGLSASGLDPSSGQSEMERLARSS